MDATLNTIKGLDMITYTAPLRDITFVLDELLEADQHYLSLSSTTVPDGDMRQAILQEASKFAQQDLLLINQSGDEQGCTFDTGEVTLPDGFSEAFKQYGEGGWAGLSMPESLGGQALPPSLGFVVNEMFGSANWAWTMYTGLTYGAIKCLLNHGSEQQINQYAKPMIAGQWSGTMCITEAHCGSDVGQARTKAVMQADGSYILTGSKHFITGGEHTMADNIIHLTLARIEGAPDGVKGISLFIVPKYLPDDQGQFTIRNQVHAGSIENKMGIKASATCTMNFDGATGFIIGSENSGLQQMFTMMNEARLGTAMQGLCAAELAYQNARSYAKERLAMRSLTGTKHPELAADPIIVHPDVRRMLLTQKALAEGFRAFLYELAFATDLIESAQDDAVKQAANDTMALLTPIAKAFCTELGFESANLGLQVFGGHGFIKETGLEQIVRDTRISTVYEGTTGIQGLDLLGRKVLGSGGELLKSYTKKIHVFCQTETPCEQLQTWQTTLAGLNKQWGELTMHVGSQAIENADEVGAASVDYLMFSGYVVLALIWLRMASVAQAALNESSNEQAFYQAKIHTAQFYFERLLPRAMAHHAAAMAGAASVMNLPDDQF